MRLTIRDLIATVLMLAIAIPYVGYLIRGEMPFIEDPRGMSAVGLLLGTTGFIALRTGDAFDRAGKLETAAALVSLGLGLAALALSETAAAEVLLAVFMASILAVWAIEMADHAGVVHWHDTAHMSGA